MYKEFKKGDIVECRFMQAEVLEDSGPNDEKVRVLCEGTKQRWWKVFEGVEVVLYSQS